MNANERPSLPAPILPTERHDKSSPPPFPLSFFPTCLEATVLRPGAPHDGAGKRKSGVSTTFSSSPTGDLPLPLFAQSSSPLVFFLPVHYAAQPLLLFPPVALSYWKKTPSAKRRVGTGRKRPKGNFFSIPSSFAPLFLAANLSRPEEAFLPLPPPPPIPSPPQKGRKGLVLLRRLQRSRMELTSPTTSSFFFPPTTIYFPPVPIILPRKEKNSVPHTRL